MTLAVQLMDENLIVPGGAIVVDNTLMKVIPMAGALRVDLSRVSIGLLMPVVPVFTRTCLV